MRCRMYCHADAAWQYKHNDTSHTAQLYSVKSYWSKRFSGPWWCGIWRPHMTCTGVTACSCISFIAELHLNRHGSLRFIMDVEKKTRGKLHSKEHKWLICTSNDLDNKFIAHQQKVMKFLFTDLVEIDWKERCAKIHVFIVKTVVYSYEKTAWGVQLFRCWLGLSQHQAVALYHLHDIFFGYSSLSHNFHCNLRQS